jgi:hypothetical protein
MTFPHAASVPFPAEVGVVTTAEGTFQSGEFSDQSEAHVAERLLG